MRKLEKAFKWINIILIILTLISYLSPFANPEIWWPLAFLGVGYPWFLLANILFVVFWVLLKNKYFLFSFFCILVGWVHFSSFVGLKIGGPPDETVALRVMSYNINKLLKIQPARDAKRKKNSKEFIALINEEIKPEILCTQETVRANVDYLSEVLHLPYHHWINRKGTAIFSAHPIVKSGEVDLGTRTNACVWADIELPNKIIRVYSLHLLSNKVSTETDAILNNGKLKQLETWQKIKRVFFKFGKAAPKRVQQAKAVIKHIEQSPHPVVLCGDLNEIPQSYTYHIFTDHLKDAFRTGARLGIGSTYAGKIPGLRIDYILTEKEIEVLYYKTLRRNYSDHYPVVSDIVIN